MPEVKKMAPTRKVATGGIAGLVVAGLVLLGQRFGVEVKPEEASFLTVLASSVMAWFTKDKKEE